MRTLSQIFFSDNRFKVKMIAGQKKKFQKNFWSKELLSLIDIVGSKIVLSPNKLQVKKIWGTNNLGTHNFRYKDFRSNKFCQKIEDQKIKVPNNFKQNK